MARITNEKVLMDRVIKMLPKGIPAEAIHSVECDPYDGSTGGPSYWVYLADGYWCPTMGCHTIHEDTLADLRPYIREIEVWADDPALEDPSQGYGSPEKPTSEAQEAPHPERKEYTNTTTHETTTSATQAMAWHRAGAAVIMTQRLAPDHVRIVRIEGAAQEAPETDDQENLRYAKRIADEVKAYYDGSLKRCPCCGHVVERGDWDDLERFQCPHCHDVGDVDQWEALGLYDYLNDALDVSYIVSSDRQTLESVRIYVTLGGPTVWIDTDTRSVELRWGGRPASWGLSFGLCDELDDWAQEMWNC